MERLSSDGFSRPTSARRASPSPKREVSSTTSRSPLAAHALSPTQQSFVSLPGGPETATEVAQKSTRGGPSGGKAKGHGSLVNDVVVGIVNAVIVRHLSLKRLMHCCVPTPSL
ncbi:MAG: hypothetical protein HC767_13575 [Akkermansiaceae bacterium]|nr:hypothetical protein [Akkermansiaceae bacterium]